MQNGKPTANSQLLPQRRRRLPMDDLGRYEPSEHDSRFLQIELVPPLYTKEHNIKLVVSWFKLSCFSLDVVLFDVFHKDIVFSLLNRRSYGIRCRVVIYRHMMFGKNRQKHYKYLEWMKSGGVEIRWASMELSPASAVEPKLFQRFILIDSTDIVAAQCHYDSCCIMGDQFTYMGTTSIVNDLYNLSLVRQPPSKVGQWRFKFSDLWTSKDAHCQFTGAYCDVHPVYGN